MIFKKMILQYCISILTYLNLIHMGSILVKFQSTIKLGLLLSVPAFLVERVTNWGMANTEYISVVLVAIGIDHILGSVRHAFFDYDFSIKKNIVGLFIKLGLVVCVGFLFESLKVIMEHDTMIKDYLVTVTRLMVFLYPAGSAFGNSSIISGGKFPPTIWIDKLKRFQKNLNTNEFKDNGGHH